jgi:hypothetical protein
MLIPKRAADRIKTGIRSFTKILEDARNADRSEQDTVTIVTDMLAMIFGYDKYTELTGEYAIRGTFCDLAVKIDGRVKYLIEIKAVGKSLKEAHVRQATDYAGKEGIDWVVLTNGIEWQAYRMKFEQPLSYEQVFIMNVLEGGSDLTEMIYMLSREGITKQALDEYREQRQTMNRHVVSAIVLSDPVLTTIRRELRRMSPGMRIDLADVKELLTSEILKRDIVEGEDLKDARRKVRRAGGRKRARRRGRAETSSTRAPTARTEPGPEHDSASDTDTGTDE